MTLFDASGAVEGTGAATGAAVVRVARALAFGGSASVTARAGVGQLVSATFHGGSALDWESVVDAVAAFSGASSVEADGSVRVASKAFAHGGSRFLYRTPLVIQGSSFISILPVIDRHLRPLRAITLGPKTFRWLQPLQRGDLSVFVCERHTPLIPFRVTYSLAQVRPDGTRKYVGPRGRVPAAGDVGEFYATGRAGESGQSGQWVIEWTFQRTQQSAGEAAEMRFQVLDAAAVGDPRDRLPRKTKFGWS
jgi:hypothetical protein